MPTVITLTNLSISTTRSYEQMMPLSRMGSRLARSLLSCSSLDTNPEWRHTLTTPSSCLWLSYVHDPVSSQSPRTCERPPTSATITARGYRALPSTTLLLVSTFTLPLISSYARTELIYNNVFSRTCLDHNHCSCRPLKTRLVLYLHVRYFKSGEGLLSGETQLARCCSIR
jgi:hypothetical protein